MLYLRWNWTAEWNIYSIEVTLKGTVISLPRSLNQDSTQTELRVLQDNIGYVVVVLNGSQKQYL